MHEQKQKCSPRIALNDMKVITKLLENLLRQPRLLKEWEA